MASFNLNAAECKASSPYAWGKGWSSSKSQAARLALHECAVRTPTYSTCYIQYCTNSRGKTENVDGQEGAPLTAAEKKNQKLVKNEQPESKMRGSVEKDKENKE